MSKLAIISDIHSNLEALNAVLDDISCQSIQEVISLGDNIGYGPDPEKVIQTIKSNGITSTLGNHELAVISSGQRQIFNADAMTALDINRRQLSERSIQYISHLVPCLNQYGAAFMHGFSPTFTNGYIFQFPKKELIRRAKDIGAHICFVGHTHLLHAYELDGKKVETKAFTQRMILLKNRQYIINAGSVGQPRHGGHEATYVVWDIFSGTVQPRFIDYNYRQTAQKMRQAEIPDIYADIL